jgi:hypothetical protein
VIILLGGIIFVMEFLLLAKFPDFKRINKPENCGNQCVNEIFAEEKEGVNLKLKPLF